MDPWKNVINYVKSMLPTFENPACFHKWSTVNNLPHQNVIAAYISLPPTGRQHKHTHTHGSVRWFGLSPGTLKSEHVKFREAETNVSEDLVVGDECLRRTCRNADELKGNIIFGILCLEVVCISVIMHWSWPLSALCNIWPYCNYPSDKCWMDHPAHVITDFISFNQFYFNHLRMLCNNHSPIFKKIIINYYLVQRCLQYNTVNAVGVSMM